jgi:GDP-mannose 6-dehydrogenase
MDVNLPMLGSVLSANQQQIERAFRAIQELPSKRVGLFGLAFKENTDDLRESPVVTLIENLLGKGRDMKIFDPHIQIENIYGTNRSFVLSAIPHIEKLMTASLDELLASCDHIVISQKPSAEALAKIRASALPVLDLVHALV